MKRSSNQNNPPQTSPKGLAQSSSNSYYSDGAGPEKVR
jgi:hypothetical protein